MDRLGRRDKPPDICDKGKFMYSFMQRTMRSRSVAHFANFLFGMIVVAAISACEKTEKIPTTAERLSSVQQKQETQPDFFVPRKTVDYMTDLKSLKDTPARTEPAPRAEPAKPVETRPQESKVAAAPAPVPAAPVVSQPTPAPAPATAAPASNVVASAAPTARPAAPRTDAVPVVSVVSREQPAFPREALRSGIDTGTVRARMTISASGDVTNVAILQAQPTRVFDRSVQTALTRWKFNPGTEGRTFDTEIAFKASN